MPEVLNSLSSTNSIYYAVLNPEDNSVEDISDNLKELSGVTDYRGKMLRQILGCLTKEGCEHNAVKLSLENKDKVIHLFRCESLGKDLFVIKYKTYINDKLRHAMIFTDTDSFSPNTELLTNLDKVINHEIGNSLNLMAVINQNLMDGMSHNELEDFDMLLSLSNQNINTIQKILAIYFDIKDSMLVDKVSANNTTRADGIIKELISDHEALVIKRKLIVNISYDEDSYSLGDDSCQLNLNKGLLYLLFSNLIDNAFKYSPESGKVDFIFSQGKDTVTIDIINEGSIDKSISESFFSKDIKGKRSNGTGFGTYCSKLITKLFQGEISMHQSDKNVTVSVKLPCNPISS